MFNSLIDSLPTKIRSTDDFNEGVKYQKRENALQKKYIELNQLYKKFIVIDIDIPNAVYSFEESNLPPPTYIVINPSNSHCHYQYELNTPVYYTENSRRRPQLFYENVDMALTTILRGDRDYVGKFTKNPMSKHWRLIKTNARYDLEDFKEYVDVGGHKVAIKFVDVLLGGRNVTLFNNLRFWAYASVHSFENYNLFQLATDQQATYINQQFNNHNNGVLGYKEVLNTSKSVGSWTWKHQNSLGDLKNRGVMQLPKDLPLNIRQSKGADYSHNIRTNDVQTKMLESAKALKAQGTPITQYSVATHSNVSIRSVKNYWSIIDNQFNLYKK